MGSGVRQPPAYMHGETTDFGMNLEVSISTRFSRISGVTSEFCEITRGTEPGPAMN